MWNPSWCDGSVAPIRFAKVTLRVALFAQRQVHVHADKQRKHQYGQNRGPLQQKASEDVNRRAILTRWSLLLAGSQPTPIAGDHEKPQCDSAYESRR